MCLFSWAGGSNHVILVNVWVLIIVLFFGARAYTVFVGVEVEFLCDPVLVMARQILVGICELPDVSMILTRMMDRVSAMALYTTQISSWETFCGLPGVRLCYVLEWAADKIQLINDEYVETLIDCNVTDEDACMGLVFMIQVSNRVPMGHSKDCSHHKRRATSF